MKTYGLLNESHFLESPSASGAAGEVRLYVEADAFSPNSSSHFIHTTPEMVRIRGQGGRLDVVAADVERPARLRCPPTSFPTGVRQ